MSDVLEHVVLKRSMEPLVKNEIVNTTYIELQFRDGGVTLQGALFSERESMEAERAGRVGGVISEDNPKGRGQATGNTATRIWESKSQFCLSKVKRGEPYKMA